MRILRGYWRKGESGVAERADAVKNSAAKRFERRQAAFRNPMKSRMAPDLRYQGKEDFYEKFNDPGGSVHSESSGEQHSLTRAYPLSEDQRECRRRSHHADAARLDKQKDYHLRGRGRSVPVSHYDEPGHADSRRGREKSVDEQPKL